MSTVLAAKAPSPAYSEETVYEIMVVGSMKNKPTDIYSHTYVVPNKPLSIDDAKTMAGFDFDQISYIEVVEVQTTKHRVKYPLDYSN